MSLRNSIVLELLRCYVLYLSCKLTFSNTEDTTSLLTSTENKKQDNKKFVESAVEKIVPQNYLKEVIPENSGLPLVVTYSLMVVDINSINAVDMDWRLDFVVKEVWRDNRLHTNQFLDSVSHTKDFVMLPSSFKEQIWQPDPFISNAKKVEVIKMKSLFESFKLYKDKRIAYTGRYAAIMSCQMSFANFPNDVQICPINITSYGFRSDRLILKWNESAPITVNDDLKLLQYEMELPIKVTTDLYENDGTSSRLIATVIFRRQLKYYVIQTFIPSVLVVCLTWLSFWFGLDATPGRVMLCVTSLLTLTTMFQGLNSPPVSYIKAIDVWMIACMVFVFATLLEFAIVLYIDKRKENSLFVEDRLNNSARPSKMTADKNRIESMPRSMAWTTGSRVSPIPSDKLPNVKQPTGDKPNDMFKAEEASTDWVSRVDYYSRYFFPMSFFIFSSVYWYYLLKRHF